MKTSSRSRQKNRENIWKDFHQLQSSKSYEGVVVKILENINHPATLSNVLRVPYVSDELFKNFLKQNFWLVTPLQLTPCTCTLTLSYEEENTLGYASGYIPKSLRKKLKTSSPLPPPQPWKKSLYFQLQVIGITLTDPVGITLTDPVDVQNDPVLKSYSAWNCAAAAQLSKERGWRWQ